MFTRPVLALYTVLCLLFSLLAIPQGPTLVCQVTGEPMTPVVAGSEAGQGSCCAVASFIDTDGATRSALTNPCCCDLIQGSERADVPAITPVAPDVPIVAVLPASPALPLLPVIAVDSPVGVSCDSVPRGPPLTPISPRAPPSSS